MSLAATLDAAIKAVCPICGVSVGDVNDKSTWTYHCLPEATDAQRAAANAVIAAFDPASVPPPFPPPNATELIVVLKQKFNMTITKADIVAARQWLANHGE